VEVDLKLTITGRMVAVTLPAIWMLSIYTGDQASEFIAAAVVFGGLGCCTSGSSAPAWTDPA
tara:strand:- start:197 stop:382 length:186 start_codon:yes stop_codon:yes gene_type:complete